MTDLPSCEAGYISATSGHLRHSRLRTAAGPYIWVTTGLSRPPRSKVYSGRQTPESRAQVGLGPEIVWQARTETADSAISRSLPAAPWGRLSRARKHHLELRDLGTFEGQRKRAALINGASIELAASAPGILFANAHLDQDQFNAAINYGRLHAIVFGRVWLNLCPLVGAPAVAAPCPTRRWSSSVRQRLEKPNGRMTLEQRQAVANVAIFGMLPTWFFAAPWYLLPLPEDECEREALLSGLTV